MACFINKKKLDNVVIHNIHSFYLGIKKMCQAAKCRLNFNLLS